MKKAISFFVTMVLFLSIIEVYAVPAIATETANQNSENGKDGNTPLIDVNDYQQNTFTDIDPTKWYYNDVVSAYQLGLLNGKGNHIFDPDGQMTVAEAIVLALRLNEMVQGKTDEFSAEETDKNWYDGYVRAAVKRKIVGENRLNELNSFSTRAQLCQFFANAFPEDYFTKINYFTEIDDVKADDASFKSILLFYNAGILTGADDKFNFKPNETIKRCEVAVILTRIAKKEKRVFQYVPVRGISIKPSNIKSEEDLNRIFGWGCNTVRIVMSMNPLFEKEAPYDLNEQNITLLKKLVYQCRDKGFRVMIDPHSFPGQSNRFTMSPNDEFWKNPNEQDAVVKLWNRLSTEFKNEGDYLEYDLMNEPVMFEGAEKNSTKDYPALINRIIGAIRENGDTHSIHVEAAYVVTKEGKNLDRISSFQYLTPFPYQKIVYNFHMYTPLGFTNNGINDTYKLTKYPNNDQGSVWNKDSMRNLFETARKFGVENNVPIIIGECGVARWQGDAGHRWLRDVLDFCREYNWGFIFHSYRDGETAFDAEMGVVRSDKTRYETTTELELLKSFWQNKPEIAPVIPESD